MLIIAWVIGLALLTVIFGRWEAHRENPNKNPESRIINGVHEVVLSENVQNHYVADGTINGKTVTFLLDTGATDVVIPAHLSGTLGLESGVAQWAMTANGAIQVHNTRIDELTLGNIRLTNVRASLNPAMQGNKILLGMSALKQVDFRQQDGVLVLRQH